MVKILTATAGDLSDGRVQSVGEKYVLEEGMATHSSILAWRIPWTVDGGLQSMGLQRVGYDLTTKQEKSPNMSI